MLQIQKNISLKAYNTFAVDVSADFFVEIHYEQDIFDLMSNNVFATSRHLILGWGANILFTKNYDWLLIKISLLGKELINEDNNNVYIKVWWGENWHDTMMRSLSQWYVWGENLVLIPGQVGSAPVGNIGAYGKEAKDIIYAVEWIDLTTKEKKVWTNSECQFAYRDSIFKHELKDTILITSVIFVFEKQSADYIPNIEYKDIQERIVAEWKNPSEISAQEIADIIISIRESKLPDWTTIGTAGSFFKNPIIAQEQYEQLLLKYPQIKGNKIQEVDSVEHHDTHKLPSVKLSAGQLIELAGYKGKSVGNVATYDKHALVIVNNGGASGIEIRAFAQSIQERVLELFWVKLEAEVIIL